MYWSARDKTQHLFCPLEKKIEKTDAKIHFYQQRAEHLWDCHRCAAAHAVIENGMIQKEAKSHDLGL